MRGQTGMTKKLLLVLALSVLGLTGCVAVPYGDGYGYAYAPAPVVAPAVSFGYYGGYYRGGHRGYRGHRHRY